MELVDVVDSKSTAGDSVPVRVRPPAPEREPMTTSVLFLTLYDLVILMKKQRFWIFILVFLIALAVVAQIFIARNQTEGDKVCIYRDNTLLYCLPLNQDTTITIPYGEDNFNTVEIKDGMVSVTDASCPDHICIHHGATNETADPIICLPNHLIIQVEREEDSNLDGVSS